jgi:hypothetical protein
MKEPDDEGKVSARPGRKEIGAGGRTREPTRVEEYHGPTWKIGIAREREREK